MSRGVATLDYFSLNAFNVWTCSCLSQVA